MLDVLGGAERDRTAGLLVANEALSQLSYSPTIGKELSYSTSRREIRIEAGRVIHSQFESPRPDRVIAFPARVGHPSQALQMIHIHQELRVVPHLFQAADKQFHRLHRRQRIEHLAQNPYALQILLGDQQLFLTRA
jgi:hypothetical protein